MKQTMSTSLELVMMTCLVIWFQLAARGVTLRCGGLFILEREDMTITLTTPGYPGMYPRLTQCQWTIVSTLNKRLAVEFVDFVIEGQSPCRYDKLMVDGNNCNFLTPTILCGDTKPKAMESSGKILCLRFLSDVVVNLRGFQVKVRLLDDNSLDQLPHVGYSPDQHKSFSENRGSPCDMWPLLVTNDVTVTSPNFGSGKLYPPNTICRWLIYTDVFHKAILRFSTIDIENHYACELDNVQILEGEEAKPDYNQKWCGSTLPGPIIIKKPKLVMFSSDGMVQGQGFSAFLEFVLVNITDFVATEKDREHYWNSSPSSDLKSSTTSPASPPFEGSRFPSTMITSEAQVKSTTDTSSNLETKLNSVITTSAAEFNTPDTTRSPESADSPFVHPSLQSSTEFTNTAGFNRSSTRDADTTASNRDISSISTITRPTDLQISSNADRAYNTTNSSNKPTTTATGSITNFRNNEDNTQPHSDYTTNIDTSDITITRDGTQITTKFSSSITTDNDLISPHTTSSRHYIPFTDGFNNTNNSNSSMDNQSIIVDICKQTYYKLTSQRVILQSPGFEAGVYPVYTRCDVVIAATDPRTSLRGTFLHMDIESSSDCGLDWLEVASRSGSLGKICGRKASNFHTRDNMMMFTFASDYIIAKSGFQLQVDVIGDDIQMTPNPRQGITEVTMCDSIFEIVGRDAITVTSPGYSIGLYPLNTSCDLKLFSSIDFVTFKVTVDDIDVEKNRACTYDYVSVYDGITSSSNILATMCGTQSGEVITTSGPNFQLHFYSDLFVAKRGFKLSVRPQYGDRDLIFTESSTKSSSLSSSTVDDGATVSTVDIGTKISTLDASTATSTVAARTQISTVEDGTARSTVDVGETRSTVDLSTISTVDDGATRSTVDASTISTVDAGTTSTVIARITISTVAHGAINSTIDVSTIKSTVETSTTVSTLGYATTKSTVVFGTKVLTAEPDTSTSKVDSGKTISTVGAATVISTADAVTAISTIDAVTTISTVDAVTAISTVDSGITNSTVNDDTTTLTVDVNSARTEVVPSTGKSSTFTSLSTNTLKAYLQTSTLAVSEDSTEAKTTTSSDSTMIFLSSSQSAEPSIETSPVLLTLSTHRSALATPDRPTQTDLTFTTLETDSGNQQTTDAVVTMPISASSSASSFPLDTACSGLSSILREKSGMVASPGFFQRQPYPNDVTCTWIIEGGRGKNIDVQFLNFSLELHPTCSYDFLELYNVSSNSMQLIRRYCGGLLPGNITSSGVALVIKFGSDRMSSSVGFLLSYNIYDIATNQSQCPDGRTLCQDNILCIPSGWLCDGERDCPLGDDEEQCHTCNDKEFACSDHSCIPLNQVCDGITNCNHGDDEYDCVKINDSRILLIKNEGTWFPVCADGHQLSSSSQFQWACAEAGRGNLLSATDVAMSSPFYILLSAHRNKTSSKNQEQNLVQTVGNRISSVCSGNKVISLQCSPRECGLQNVNLPQPYVVGSGSSVDGQWPWTVALFSGSNFKCGATLVSRYWLVTAGHCLYSLVSSPQTTTARVGHVNIQSPDVVVKQISEIIFHPQHNYIYENDIGLIRLGSPIDISPNLRPICLDASPRDWTSNTRCHVAGWGVTDKTKVNYNQPTTILHDAKVTIWERSKCEISYPGKIKRSMLCAGYQDGEMDACKGDSGGPLMCLNHFNQWQLVGVVSWGEGCGQIGKPGVYTKVDSYLDWISITTNEEVNYGVSCDFEHSNICGYSSHSGSEFMWTRRVGGVSSIPKPYLDNTFKNESGHYMYSYVPYGVKYMTATLMPPLLPVSDVGYCLLASTAFQECNECKLEVRATDCSGNQTQTLFKISSDISTNWMRFEVDLPQDTCQINFLSTSGRQSEGGIGLDDVTLTLGSCEDSKLLSCNFSLNSSLDNNGFSKDALCGYKHDTTDDFNWVVSHSNADTSGELDSFLRAQQIYGYPGDRARIISPVLKSTISMCFSFRFRISSSTAGNLKVCTKVYYKENASTDCSLWSSTLVQNIQADVWTKVKIKLPVLSLEFSVVLQMSRGDDPGYIDVDSLFKRDGDCL